MAETIKYSVEKEMGCGFMTSIFPRAFGPRKTAGKSFPTNRNQKSIEFPTNGHTKSVTFPSTNTTKRRRVHAANWAKPPPKLHEKPSAKPSSASPIPSNSLRQNQRRTASDARRSSTPSSNGSGPKQIPKVPESVEFRRPKKEPTFTSGELGLVPSVHRKSDSSGMLFRASSGNIMLLGQLGNLKKQQENNIPPSKRSRFVNKLDPEALKSLGNDKYKEGRFEEALDLYNQAISLDSKRASYHSNKSAALIGLGRLIEAAVECREAARIEPSYLRAHHRLATLYLRLGEAEKALHHYKQAGLKADAKEIAKAQALKTHLNGCKRATELRDWSSLLKECQSAFSSGADSAPQIYAMQVDALFKLHRHQEAYDTFEKGLNFDIDSCTRLFGRAYGAYLLTIQAQVFMVVGRFEDALAAGQQATRLDSSEKVNAVVKRAQAVSLARSNGNRLFKASKFSEASASYSEGLEHDTYNSILLCNRAACRSKLGQFEKAVEDCSAALNVRPSYSKAMLRRADCNAKLERWEAAIQDYEMLIQETPGDEEVGKALFGARLQLKKQHCEVTNELDFGSNLVLISTKESFRNFVTAPGMSVVLFCDRTCHKEVFQLMEQVHKGFPSISFLKVEIEDHPYLAKSEGVSSLPAFKIYKNGSKIKEIPCNNRELLESSVKLYSS